MIRREPKMLLNLINYLKNVNIYLEISSKIILNLDRAHLCIELIFLREDFY